MMNFKCCVTTWGAVQVFAPDGGEASPAPSPKRFRAHDEAYEADAKLSHELYESRIRNHAVLQNQPVFSCVRRFRFHLCALPYAYALLA